MIESQANSIAAVAKPERVGFSLRRVWIIGLNTFTESMRQKVFNILLVFALVAIGSASFFTQFTFNVQLKFIKDFCLGAMSVFGTLIAIVGTAQLLPNELENRTIYTILAKPVRRLEFILGKYTGAALLLFLTVLMMSVMTGIVLKFKEVRMIADAQQVVQQSVSPEERSLTEEDLAQIRTETRDMDMVKAVILIFVKLSLLAAITLLISTFSTSMVFNVAIAFMVFFAGHMRSTAAEAWAQHKIWLALLAIIPDLGAFNVADDINLGNMIPWQHVGQVTVDGLGRIVVILIATHLIFAKREI
ncbi:MAG: ABC transporter permease subunit [Verrucomicrobiia bacterium]